MLDSLREHFITLFLIFLFAVRLGYQRSARDKELRWFWLTVICSLALVIEDVLEVMTAQNPDLLYWRILLSVLGYVLRCTASAGLVYIVSRPEYRKKWIWIPWAINLAVCCTAFFTDIAFGFDEDYAFYRGPLGYVCFIVPFFYLMMILYLTFRRYSEGSRKSDRIILVTCVVLCISASVLDALHGGVRLNMAIMVSCTFFYIFLRSYDVRRDSLTRVLNRQSLYADCAEEKKHISAVASLDMNGLKEINEKQGRAAGDAALKKIGDCLRAVTDPDVRAYRIGGDEFLILFIRKDEITVRQIMHEMGERLAKTGYNIASGFAMREADEDPENLIHRADVRMFEQKAQYYRDKMHDRRRNRRTDNGREETRRTLAESHQPLAVLRLGDHRVETLLVSEGFCKLFGYPDREKALHVLDQDIYKDIHHDDQERYSGALLRFSEGMDELDVVYRTKAGMDSGYRVIHARGIHLHTASEERIAEVWYMDEGVYEDDGEAGSLMTQALSRALHEESIVNAYHYDELTGLPTPAWFFQLCEAKKAQVFSEGKQAAMIYIDLNGMKYFNHKFGFTEGDNLLKAFAALMAEIFGKDSCCHIAADRFAAGSAEDETEAKVKRLIAEAENINGGNTLPLRIGIYSTAMEDVAVSTAFDRAKIAFDSMRRSGSSGYQFYQERMRDAFRKRQYIVSNIDRAVQENWIKVYYQPIVRAADETLCDEEALARWIDPVEGFLSPADFIPQLEEEGLIWKLDLYILDRVLEKIVQRQAAGLEVVPQSVNLSRSDFETCDIVEEIRRRVDEAGVSHDLITIEITESVIGSDFEFMNEQVDRFQNEGFAVWMDDFGSGYSSLDVLRDIHFDLIKFDMSFLRKLDEGDKGKIILRELMKLAGRLNLDTVCEGVEKEEHVRFLQEINCSKLQGYYFGKPAPWEPETPQEQEPEQPEQQAEQPSEQGSEQ